MICISAEFSVNRPLPLLNYRHIAESNFCKPVAHLQVCQSLTNTSIYLENGGFQIQQGVWPIIYTWPERF